MIFLHFSVDEFFGKLKSIMGNNREWMFNTDELGLDYSEIIKTLVSDWQQ